jgi:glycosyltransferase involved in cell wall biosynthesis
MFTLHGVRVALITDTFTPQVNGVTTVLTRMRDAIESAGLEVTVVGPRYPGNRNSANGSGLCIPSLPLPIYPAIRLSAPFSQRVKRHLDEFGPDVIHVPTEGPLGLLGRRYALRRGLPLITSFHTDFPLYARHYGAGWLEAAVWRWLVWFHEPAKLIQTPGEAVLRKLEERGLKQAKLWGRGVETRRFRPGLRQDSWRTVRGIAPDQLLVVHVGRLAREKNTDLLLDAWSEAHAHLDDRAVFLLVGDGPMAKVIDRRAPWIRRIGFISRDELAEIYANSDICVLPSTTETLGLVALEAMASGLAVIAADTGGFRETIADGIDGLLVRPDDALAFAAAILQLAEIPDLRRRLGRAARCMTESRDTARENRELIEQYESVLPTGVPLVVF